MKVEIKQAVRFTGVNGLAIKTGYSKTHISRVLHGQRKAGSDLDKKLKRLGVSPLPNRDEKEQP